MIGRSLTLAFILVSTASRAQTQDCSWSPHFDKLGPTRQALVKQRLQDGSEVTFPVDYLKQVVARYRDYYENDIKAPSIQKFGCDTSVISEKVDNSTCGILLNQLYNEMANAEEALGEIDIINCKATAQSFPQTRSTPQAPPESRSSYGPSADASRKASQAPTTQPSSANKLVPGLPGCARWEYTDKDGAYWLINSCAQDVDVKWTSEKGVEFGEGLIRAGKRQPMSMFGMGGNPETNGRLWIYICPENMSAVRPDGSVFGTEAYHGPYLCR